MRALPLLAPGQSFWVEKGPWEADPGHWENSPRRVGRFNDTATAQLGTVRTGVIAAPVLTVPRNMQSMEG